MRQPRHKRGVTGGARHSTARSLVAGTFVAVFLISLPTAPAAAQTGPGACLEDPAACLPEVPDPDPCVENPQSCVPDVPEVPDPDPCVENPQSCLPELPDPDPCLENPQSCLPDPKPCLENPQSCLPDVPGPEDITNKVERCVNDPTQCLDEATGVVDDVEACAKDPKGCLSDPTDPLLDQVLGAHGVSPSDPRSSGGRGNGTGGDQAGRDPASRSSDETGAEAEVGAPESIDPFALVNTRQVDEGGDGLLGGIGRTFGDIIRRIGFPLALLAIVAGFLALQNRLDRKDPKLAVAAVDSQRDSLTFE